MRPAARFFGLSRDETEFLLLLISYNRAGTTELKRFYEKLIGERVEKHALLKHRLKIRETLSREDQAVYYSSWQFGAVHMALTIPALRTREAIAKALGLSLPKVGVILEFLVSKGLARKEHPLFIPTAAFLHLEKDSPLISKHHANWRMRALQSLDSETQSDLHYSLVFSCAEKDLPKLRERLTRCLEECADIIRPSAEERLAGLCMDLFEI